MGRSEYLGEFEQTVMFATLQLGENAYGMTIRREIHARTGRDVSVGSVYVALDRLEAKGFVRSWMGEATPERGGRAKKYFAVTGAGERALKQSRETIRVMSAGLGPKLGWGRA